MPSFLLIFEKRLAGPHLTPLHPYTNRPTCLSPSSSSRETNNLLKSDAASRSVTGRTGATTSSHKTGKIAAPQSHGHLPNAHCPNRRRRSRATDAMPTRYTAVVVGLDHDLEQALWPGIADGIADPRLQNDPHTFTFFQTLSPSFQIDMVISDMTGQFVLSQNPQNFIIRLCRKNPLPWASRSFREISLPFCGCSATGLAGGKE